MKILAIETSCDETGIAILEASMAGKKGEKSAALSEPHFSVLANIISSQIAIHAHFGGVVPNLAKREHEKNLVPVLEIALKKAKIDNKAKNKVLARKSMNQEIKRIFSHEPVLYERFQKLLLLAPPTIDVLAVTKGPGLEPALWAGVNFGRALALLWRKPLLGVNHLEGHVYAVFLNREIPKFQFPALALIVSGGHTELVLMRKWLDYRMIGETLDDAAGEAFDKVAKMLGLPYPGGPEIAKLAEKGNAHAFPFPRPMMTSKDFSLSFSGLKTAVLYTLRDLEAEGKKVSKADIAASFQEAVVEVLAEKTFRAAKQYRVKSLILGGGVAANSRLREFLEEKTKKVKGLKLFLPERSMTTDNAAIIGAASYHHFLKGERSDWKTLCAQANLRIL